MCKPLAEPTDDAKVSHCQNQIKTPRIYSEIHIRTYQGEDEKECQDLFVQGRMSLLTDYYKVVLFRSYESGAFYSVMLLSLIYLPMWAVALMVTSWFVIWYCVVKRAFHMYLKSQFLKDMNDIEGVYMKDGGTFLVATMGGRIMGMVGGRRNQKNENDFFVCRMNVDQRAQKRGIAGQLMTRLELFSRAQGFEAMSLTCTVAQHAAHALYRKHGFEMQSTIPSHAGLSGVHICLYRKQLDYE
jgi:GNAT superfamily N-acetyltransferase